MTYAPNPDGRRRVKRSAPRVETEVRAAHDAGRAASRRPAPLVDGKPLAAFGSQGQQRTAVLALKVAEYDVMRSRAGDAPILLLDDVLSELDAERAGGFLGAVEGFEQAFLTTTELPRHLGAAATWSIHAATVTPC